MRTPFLTSETQKVGPRLRSKVGRQLGMGPKLRLVRVESPSSEFIGMAA